MNVFELIYFLSLTTSVAFCFLYQHPNAFPLTFAVGAGGFFLFYVVMLVFGTIITRTGRANDPDFGEGAVAFRISRGVLIVAGLCLLVSVVMLCAYPIATGIAALLAFLVTQFGSRRTRVGAFSCLGAALLASVVTFLFHRLHHHS